MATTILYVVKTKVQAFGPDGREFKDDSTGWEIFYVEAVDDDDAKLKADERISQMGGTCPPHQPNEIYYTRTIVSILPKQD